MLATEGQGLNPTEAAADLAWALAELYNPDTFAETNLSQMIAYSIYRGVSEKWLDGSCPEFADRMRKAAHGKVDEFGFARGVCGSPTFSHPGTAAEGKAFFLLMEAAYSTSEA